MATLTIYTKTTDMPREHLDLFWNFSPDDWDYFILGHNRDVVEAVADALMICDTEIKQLGENGIWAAVTYHS